jgi:hypothetical protein
LRLAVATTIDRDGAEHLVNISSKQECCSEATRMRRRRAPKLEQRTSPRDPIQAQILGKDALCTRKRHTHAWTRCLNGKARGPATRDVFERHTARSNGNAPNMAKQHARNYGAGPDSYHGEQLTQTFALDVPTCASPQLRKSFRFCSETVITGLAVLPIAKRIAGCESRGKVPEAALPGQHQVSHTDEGEVSVSGAYKRQALRLGRTA